MANFDLPDNTSLYDAVWDLVHSIFETVVTMFEGTSDSNIPDKAKRYNISTNKFEKYSSGGASWSVLGFHTAIDNHIADTALHAGVPSGGIVAFGGSAAPTNYLMCDGAAYNRVTYAALFAAIGTNYGAPDGSTFNVPNLQGRFPLGKATAGTGNTLGATGGSLDHTHSVANHAHAIAAHTHTMGNHTHTVSAHTHSTPAHEHTVPSHGHAVTHAFATLAISVAGGTHGHTVGTRDHSGTASGDNRAGMSDGSGSTGSINTGSQTHTHAHAEFTGTVGAWNGGGTGVSGDGEITTTNGAGGTTGSGGSGTSGAPSTNTTDSGGPTTTSTDGGHTSGSNNPAYQVVNYIIRI